MKGLHFVCSFSLAIGLATGFAPLPNHLAPPTAFLSQGTLSLAQPKEYVLFYQSDDATEVSETATSTEIVERPDPSTLLAAQSDTKQRFGFVAICVFLSIGTYVAIDALDFVEWILPEGYFALWRDFTWPVPLGLIYLAAGVAHFAMKVSLCVNRKERTFLVFSVNR